MTGFQKFSNFQCLLFLLTFQKILTPSQSTVKNWFNYQNIGLVFYCNMFKIQYFQIESVIVTGSKNLQIFEIFLKNDFTSTGCNYSERNRIKKFLITKM